MDITRPLEICAIDVETTGLNPENDRIISVGLVRATIDVNEKHIDAKTLQVIVNPGIPIPLEASKIHGIYDRDVKNEAPFEEVAQQVRDFIGNRILVGHNVSFDKAFLSASFKKTGLKSLHRNRSICTMLKMKELRGYFGAGYVNTSLDDTALLLGFGGRKGKRHTALEDALLSLGIAGWFLRYEAGVGELSDEHLQEAFSLWKTKEGRNLLRKELEKIGRSKIRMMQNPQIHKTEQRDGSNFGTAFLLLVLSAMGIYLFSLF